MPFSFAMNPKSCQKLPAPRNYVNKADINFDSRFALVWTLDGRSHGRTQKPIRTLLTAEDGSICPSSNCSSSPTGTSRPTPTRSWRHTVSAAPHHRVLHFVNRKPGLTVAELLDVLQITKQSLARVLKQLIDTATSFRCRARDRRQRETLSDHQGPSWRLTSQGRNRGVSTRL